MIGRVGVAEAIMLGMSELVLRLLAGDVGEAGEAGTVAGRFTGAIMLEM